MSDALIIGGFTALIILIIFWYASGTSKQAKENREFLRENREVLEQATIDPETQKLIRIIAIIFGLIMIFSTIYFMFFWSI